MQPSEKKGLIISTSLHVAALVWLIVATFFWHSSSGEETPVVFDLLPGPVNMHDVPGPKAPGPVDGKKPGAPLEDEGVQFPDLKAPNIPDVPVVEPEPAPPAREPTPAAPTPEPAPAPKPTPAAPKVPAKPKAPTTPQMSYAEFLKNTREGKRIKNTPSTTTTSRPRGGDAPRIKIDKGAIGQMRVPGGEYGGGGGPSNNKGVGVDRGEGGKASALNSYMSALRTRIDAAWEKPDISGAGISATVTFTVSNSGLISARHISKGSGSASFDQSILNVFDRLGYVGTPPGGAQTFELTFKLEG